MLFKKYINFLINNYKLNYEYIWLLHYLSINKFKKYFKGILVNLGSGGFWTTNTIKFNNHSLKYSRKTKRYPILKFITKWCLFPIWTITQVLALFLDKIDKN